MERESINLGLKGIIHFDLAQRGILSVTFLELIKVATLSLGDYVVGGLVIGIYDPWNFFSGFSHVNGYSYQIRKYWSGQIH